MSYYEFHIFACQNQRAPGAPRPSCGVERGEEIRVAFQQSLRRHGVKESRVNKAGCLDRCEHGPVVVIYPQNVWYRIEDIATDVDEIVREHLVGGQIVTRLQLPAERSAK